jgi:hypothetical protein
VTPPVLFEPEAAIAASLCMTARIVSRHGVSERHPRRCGWCDYPIETLRQLVDGFNEWAGYQEKTGTYREHEARRFQGLPRSEQLRLITEAQAFPPDEPVPMPSPPPVAASEPVTAAPSRSIVKEAAEWVL